MSENTERNGNTSDGFFILCIVTALLGIMIRQNLQRINYGINQNQAILERLDALEAQLQPEEGR